MFTFDFGVKYGQIIQHHVLVCGIQCVCKCWTGVWGSAFSILFNRILGFNDVPNGSTMEEELGTITSFFTDPRTVLHCLSTLCFNENTSVFICMPHKFLHICIECKCPSFTKFYIFFFPCVLEECCRMMVPCVFACLTVRWYETVMLSDSYTIVWLLRNLFK